MIKFLYRFFRNETDAGPTQIDHQRMFLEERILWRKEMVFKIVREIMNSLEIVNAMYKVNVVPLDERAHYFYTVIDIDKTFAVGKKAKVKGMSDIEKLIIEKAWNQYGISVCGLYWRAKDADNVFDIMRLKVVEDFRDTQPLEPGWKPRMSHRIKFSPVDPDELAAFTAALRKGLNPPPMMVGDKEYLSDVAPLRMMDGMDFADTDRFKN